MSISVKITNDQQRQTHTFYTVSYTNRITFLPWRDRPGGPRPPHGPVSQLHLDTPYLVGLLWTSDQPITETST